MGEGPAARAAAAEPVAAVTIEAPVATIDAMRDLLDETSCCRLRGRSQELPI
jgi:hypothetical protein